MKKKICLLFACALILQLGAVLSGCGAGAESEPTVSRPPKFEIEMELTKDYDDADPFIDERLFYVTEDVDALELDILYQLKGEGGILEIADNNTDAVLWSYACSESVESAALAAPLNSLQTDKEYVIRFTGTKIEYANIVAASESDFIKERSRPLEQPDIAASASDIHVTENEIYTIEETTKDDFIREQSGMSEQPDIITSEFDIYLTKDETTFLTIEAAEDMDAVVHYSYTTREKEGAAWGYYLEGDESRAPYELRAGTESVYLYFWTDETVHLKNGKNVFYICGDGVSCKMHFEVKGIDKTKVTVKCPEFVTCSESE